MESRHLLHQVNVSPIAPRYNDIQQSVPRTFAAPQPVHAAVQPGAMTVPQHLAAAAHGYQLPPPPSHRAPSPLRLPMVAMNKCASKRYDGRDLQQNRCTLRVPLPLDYVKVVPTTRMEIHTADGRGLGFRVKLTNIEEVRQTISLADQEVPQYSRIVSTERAMFPCEPNFEIPTGKRADHLTIGEVVKKISNRQHKWYREFSNVWAEEWTWKDRVWDQWRHNPREDVMFIVAIVMVQGCDGRVCWIPEIEMRYFEIDTTFRA